MSGDKKHFLESLGCTAAQIAKMEASERGVKSTKSTQIAELVYTALRSGKIHQIAPKHTVKSSLSPAGFIVDRLISQAQQ